METLNKKDNKILAELTLNSRIPINQLAKRVGLSREVVNYRLNNLIKKKIIKEFYSIVNIESLGFSRSGCFLQLKGISRQKEKEFLDYMIKHKSINYLGPTIGKWNFAFDIIYPNKEQLSKIITELKSKFGKYLGSFIMVSDALEQEFFPAKMFGSKKEIDVKESKAKPKPDNLDFKILNLLSKNSRIEYTELSKKLNLSANAIKYRIKNLENSGVIQGYTCLVDVKKLGYEWHNIQIKLTGLEDKNLKEFLRKHKKVIYFYRHIGNENWDLDIGFISENSEELRNFILDLREKFGDLVKLNDVYIIVEESKSNAPPEGVFHPDKL